MCRGNFVTALLFSRERRKNEEGEEGKQVNLFAYLAK